MRWICALVIAIAMNPLLVSNAQSEEDTDRTLRHAIIAYTDEDFDSAFVQMQEYLPLASADAAYYLGLMSIEGLGTDYNPIDSLAYLRAATEWKHSGAEAIAKQIEPHLNPEELALVTEKLEELQQQVTVQHSRHTFEQLDLPRPERYRSKAPDYPLHEVRYGHETWMTLVQVISPDGKIITSEALNEAPQDFQRAYRKVQSQWRYRNVEQLFPIITRLSFTIEKTTREEIETINKTFERAFALASAGVPEQQMFLANFADERASLGHNEELSNIHKRDWYERSARGGFLMAQRYLAISYDSEVWAEYLISRGDLTTTTFYGLNLRTFAADAELRTYGEQLIREAAAAGDENAIAILDHLVDEGR